MRYQESITRSISRKTTQMKYEIKQIRTVNTPGKGSLSFFESGRDVPFEIKRMYFIHQVPTGVQRGGHAHRRLCQLLFCPYGSIEIVLDDGVAEERILLDDPSKGLLVGNLVWRDMIWRKDDSILAVAASNYYDESDYIREYKDFLDELNLQGEKDD